MRDWVQERLDRLDALFPPARLARSRERWTRLWHGQPPLDRLPFVFAPLALDYYAPARDPEQRLRELLDEIVRRGPLDDDFIPAFFPGCRQATIPNMFGARELEIAGDFSAEHLIRAAADLERLPVPAIRPGSIAAAWLDMIRYVAAETEGRLPIHVTDMQGPLDVCGNLWDYREVLMLAYDEPAAFHAFLARVADAFVELWQRQADAAGNLFVGTHLFGWSWVPPAAGASLSADSLVMISADFYREFYQPCLERIAARFGGLAVHSCGNFATVVPALCATAGLKAVNAGQMSVAALVDAGADGRTLVIANAPEADAPRLFDLSRQRGQRVDLTIALTPPEGRPATAWTAADWAALRRANDTILAAAHG